MGLIDIVLGALLVFGLVKGLRNGLFVEIASLFAFFVGIFIAIKFSYIVGNLLGDSITSSAKTGKVIAFVITLAIVVIAIHLLAKVFSGIASFVFLGWLNKLGGAVFATLKTALLLGIVLSLFQKININDAVLSKDTQDNSLFFNPLLKTSETLLPFLTDWFNDLKVKASENLNENNSTVKDTLI